MSPRVPIFGTMLQQFLNHIKNNNLCSATDTILLAVSGGLDSMVMLNLFKEAGFTVAVAHCNFQLRGEESKGDERFVETECKKLAIPFYVTHFNTEVYAQENGLSIQMAARELRYQWFNQIMDQNGFTCLATAHHLNDSIETALLNWVHGSSLEGFGGIPVKNGRVIRPLLFAIKEKLKIYAAENNIVWREDSSNLTDDYQRNFIRHQIIPRLKELNPSLEETFATAQRKIKVELGFIEAQFIDWQSTNVVAKDNAVYIVKQGLTHITLLWRAIREFGFNFSQCEDAMRALAGQSGKKFTSATHQLVIDREHLIVSPSKVGWDDVLIEKGCEHATMGNWQLRIGTGQGAQETTIGAEALLDSDKLVFPLRWRLWKPGDSFYPLGMEHKKKLSDFLIDKKVSLTEKQYVSVLESDGQIVWVVGHRIDNRFRLTSATSSVISFKLIPHL
jgi:tRNA(Ile)-lysidine synthase